VLLSPYIPNTIPKMTNMTKTKQTGIFPSVKYFLIFISRQSQSDISITFQKLKIIKQIAMGNARKNEAN